MFIALKLYRVLKGVMTWSWYIPITTSNFFILFFVNKVSAGNGPLTLRFFFCACLIAGLIILFSSLFLKFDSQWGFNPVTANFGIFWVTAFFFVGLYILFTGPEGTWPFFIINVIVFAMATVYNFCFHFKIAFLFGRDKVNSTIEQPIVSAVVLVLNVIIIYGLSDKIYL